MARTPEQIHHPDMTVSIGGTWGHYVRDDCGYSDEAPGILPDPNRVIAYAQQDDRWHNHLMGGVPQTIGGYGCAMVCACMVYSQALMPADTSTRPDEFNRILTEHNGYNIVNSKEAHLAWDRLPDIFLGLAWKGRESWARLLNQHDLDRVFGFIDDAPLVLWVDFKPNKAGMQTHFVLATGHTQDDIEIIDPWQGARSTLMTRYGREGGDSLKRAIWGYRRLVVR